MSLAYYIFDVDVYCVDCGESIKQKIRMEGQAPVAPWDETTYDSGDYPKGPYDATKAADQPLICAAGKYCLNAETLLSGRKVGQFLENPLTPEGERYVLDEHETNPSEVTHMWLAFYELDPNE